YDAKTSVWQSADPLLGSLSSCPSSGTILGLSRSAYTSGRPTRFIDPHGMSEDFPYSNPLRWPGALLQAAGEFVASLGIPVISQVFRTLQSAGQLLESPGLAVEG